MPVIFFPDGWRIIIAKKLEQIKAVVEAGIDFRAVEVAEGVDAGVIREKDGGGDGGIGGETWVFEHTAVEDEFEHMGIGAEPGVGAVVGFLTEAVVGNVRTEVVE